MELKNYHPAVCEFEIFHAHKQTIANIISGEALQVIDLGSGDARKSKVLLEHLVQNDLRIHYIPIDISTGAVRNLVASLESKFSNTSLTVSGIAAEYFQGLEAVPREQFKRNFVFFLGLLLVRFEQQEKSIPEFHASDFHHSRHLCDIHQQ